MIAADISFWTFTWYAFAGLVIGVLAKLLMPGKQNMNIIATILLGVVSAIIGAFLWNAIFKDQEGGVDRWGRGCGDPSLALFAVRTEGAAERIMLPS